MKQIITPLVAAAALLSACSKSAEKPQVNVAPKAEVVAPVNPPATSVPSAAAAKPAPAQITDSSKVDNSDIDPDAVNLDNLDKPLVAREKKPVEQKPEQHSETP